MLSNAFKWWQVWAQSQGWRPNCLPWTQKAPPKAGSSLLSPASCHPLLPPILWDFNLTEMLLLHISVQFSPALSALSLTPCFPSLPSHHHHSFKSMYHCSYLNLEVTADMMTLCLPVSLFRPLWIYTGSTQYHISTCISIMHMHQRWCLSCIWLVILTMYTLNRGLSYVILINL